MMQKPRTGSRAPRPLDGPKAGDTKPGRFGEADKRAADLLLARWAFEQLVAERQQPTGVALNER